MAQNGNNLQNGYMNVKTKKKKACFERFRMAIKEPMSPEKQRVFNGAD